MLLRLPLLLMLCVSLLSCGSGKGPDSRFEVAINGIHGGTISDNGKQAVIGSVFHGGSFWQLNDQERLYDWNHSQDELSILISADIEPGNRWALTAEAHTMVLWDITTGEAARFWTAPGEVLDVDLATGGRYALLGQADHNAVIFNVIRGGIVRSFTHQGRVRSVDLSADGRLAITGSEDQTAALWRVDSGEKLMTMEHQEDVQLVALSPDGNYAFTAAKYDNASLWDTRSGQLLNTIPLSKERIKRGLRITAARFSQDGRQLLLGYSNRTVELWDVNTNQLMDSWQLTKRHRWQPSGVAVTDLAFGDGNQQIMVVGSNGFIYRLSTQQ